ncbi:MAG TPA: uracil-DNA glycosylase family protein, partial [Micropepsaceae bacterium]
MGFSMLSREVREIKTAPAGKDALARLIAGIRGCDICAKDLAHGVRPVLRIGPTARLCIAGQAPGIRVHNTGIPYNDPSGTRLRAWLGIDREVFYDESRIAIVPMGFCFPGYDAAGADKPPRNECVRTWHDRLFAVAP